MIDGLLKRILSVALLLAWPSLAFAGLWTYAPEGMGNVPYPTFNNASGRWSLVLPLGSSTACPDFPLTLQLVYLNQREKGGCLGSQWFCPQFESLVLPKGKKQLSWITPGADEVGLYQQENGTFCDASHLWIAKITSPTATVIANPNGWSFLYCSGKLALVTAPSGRGLAFAYGKTGLESITVQIKAGQSNAQTDVEEVRCRYEKNQIVQMETGGQLRWTFAYAPIKNGQLLQSLTPAIGGGIAFDYLPTAPRVLAAIQPKPGGKRVEFKTMYVVNGGRRGTAKPSCYWLVADANLEYQYKEIKKQDNRWDADVIIYRDRQSGRELKAFRESVRGCMKLEDAKEWSKRFQFTYYYLAPGQCYNGRLRRVEDERGLVIEYFYDVKTGRLLAIEDGRKGKLQFLDYADNQPLGLTAKPFRIREGTRMKNKIVATVEYDARGNIATAINEFGHKTEFFYNDKGELVATTSPQGIRTSLVYDDLGRCISTGINENQPQTFAYDRHGRLLASSDRLGNQYGLVYDANGQLKCVQRNQEKLSESFYDELGRRTAVVDALGRKTEFDYDLAGNLLAEKKPGGIITRFEYDAEGHRTAQIDANGNKISFAFDAKGRMVEQKNPLGQAMTWEYDAEGRLCQRSNGMQKIVFTYNKFDAPTAINYGDGIKVNYAYDAERRPDKISNESTSYEYFYNDRGQLEGLLAKATGYPEQALRYGYDSFGRRTSLTLSEKNGQDYRLLLQADYRYDAFDRLVEIKANGLPIATYSYDAQGRPIGKILGNGVMTKIVHDPYGRLTETAFSGGPGFGIQAMRYTWDVGDRLLARTWNGQEQKFAYDATGQLIEARDAKTGKVLETYKYDAAGNMVEKVVDGVKTAMAYNAANQLVEQSYPDEPMKPKRKLSYDPAGRLVDAGDGSLLTYGGLDKVLSKKDPNGKTVEFRYWPDGQLAFKKGGSTEFMVWDGLALLRNKNQIFICEPHVVGGAVLCSYPVGVPGKLTWHLNDLLGTSLGKVDAKGFNPVPLSAFGQPKNLKQGELRLAAPPSNSKPTLPTAPEAAIQ
jgi:YD repeat-containing protein